MLEKEITICGHGSGVPTCKNMETYLQGRWEQKAPNGVRKGLVAVRRVPGMTDEERKKWKAAYTEILGRNLYSQELREHVFDPYRGWYYSDCSSSGDACFARAGHDVGWLNTEGQYVRLSPVPAVIKDGHVTNPEVLQVGDCLLFAGNPSRPLEIGHVEYVFDIPESWHWIQAAGAWYYQDKEGRNSYGWKLIPETGDPQKKHWYYFAGDGKMETGVIEADGKRFYLATDGPLEGACCRTDETGALSVWCV